MSQQALNLRRSLQIVRLHKILIGATVALGLLIGAGYAALKPPPLTSTALVVLPQAPSQNTQAAGGGTGTSTGPDTYMATQAVVASSDAVLSGALPHVGSSMSLQTLGNKIQVKSLTGNILSISASGGTAAQAEATANAVARSYVAYVTAASSPLGHTPARVLQTATNAIGSTLVKRVLLFALIGALVGGLIGFVVALVISREKRRLRERDDIANSLGVPVLASIPVGHPSDAAGWTKLLENYEPGVVHAWQLRKAFDQLGIADITLSNHGAARPSSLAVLSFTSDRKALALGPQLASFAASLGIPTALVVGPQQDANATATLRTACAVPPHSPSERMKHLRILVSDDGNVAVPRGAALVVVIVVVDTRTPRMPETMYTAMAVLGVSPGAATAEQLARAATVAASDGREITGILVADPDPDDQTSGRIPQSVWSARRWPLSRSRTPDLTTELKR